MSVEAGGRVQFDFDGSLQLARQLWKLADDLLTEDGKRETDYDTAVAKWEGAYGEEFVGRRSDERTSKWRVWSELRSDARLWAQSWAGAMDQQNKNNRAARVNELEEEKRNNRSWAERNIGDRFVGDDSREQAESEVPEPAPVPVPTPPSFAATATETRY